MVEADTQFSNYPPLYYLLVGIPSLVARGTNAVYAMRMLGTLINGALIALGLFLLVRYHPRRGPLVGVLVALSPMVFFVTSVLNSSGMEIASAFAAWCGGLCVIEYRRVPAGLAGWTSLAFVVLVLSRPISPINAGVIILALATLAGWPSCKEVARDRSTLVIRLSLLGGIVVAGIFLLIGGVPGLLGFPNKPRLSLEQSIWLTLRLTELRLRQSTASSDGWTHRFPKPCSLSGSQQWDSSQPSGFPCLPGADEHSLCSPSASLPCRSSSNRLGSTPSVRTGRAVTGYRF